MTATDMDGALHTDVWKFETSREIKKMLCLWLCFENGILLP